MNKTNLKAYAPEARLDFISAVTSRANLLGIHQDGHSSVEARGDVVLIDGREWPAAVGQKREKLIERIAREGHAQTMEAVAYTWFNRFAALRFMEIHDYLQHGWRVLSSRDGGLPEILAHAGEVSLSGLDLDRARDMQLAGNQDNELYKLLLVAQCNELSRSMPFLFEHIDDETELLLPENLLRTDSIVSKLVAAVPETDWENIEAIGWLYQFYISEKKAQVIGKVVKSEDIPAATQLFTPNWVVKFLTQNSIGRLWMLANPTSSLSASWTYLTDNAPQSDEALEHINDLVQTRIAMDGEMLNPESITMIDPACGSGHILVEGYDVLKAMYLERGYRLRDIPRLILEKNLYGIDIDERAAQLSGFALLMKARADDRKIFENAPSVNIISLCSSTGLDLDELANNLLSHGICRADIAMLLEAFVDAKTLGSLIQVSPALGAAIDGILQRLTAAQQAGDLYAKAAAEDLLPLAKQTRALSTQYDAVVANPPYMGTKGMNEVLKNFAKMNFPDSKSDLFAMFIERGFDWCRPSGFNSMVTMHSWMFLSSYEAMRANLLRNRTLSTLVHMGNGVMGIAFGTAASVFFKHHLRDYQASFSYCENDDVGDDGYPIVFPVDNERLKTARPDDFDKIPGSPVAYWVSDAVRSAFADNTSLSRVANPTGGMTTGSNATFLRLWHEVAFSNIGIDFVDRLSARESGMKWFPYNKGGAFRKWYGNNDFVVNWKNDGQAIEESGRAYPRSKNYYFKRSITYSSTSSSYFGVRHSDRGFLFDAKGSSAFVDGDAHYGVLAFLVSKPVAYFLRFLNPTIEFQTGDIARLPLALAKASDSQIVDASKRAIAISKLDWDTQESSWGFSELPLVALAKDVKSLAESWNAWKATADKRIEDLQAIEEENNRFWINAYGLQSEIDPHVPVSLITLRRADREKDAQRLVSYAIGCMMGRYSLDSPGLVYAGANGREFEQGRYVRFPADDDGIVPNMDDLWFEDDAAYRMRRFLGIVWGEEHIDKNLAWLAESLGAKGDEAPEESIRRYVSGKFFKDHMQVYSKRPIYWQFSSGKLGAFQALVYAHRYNEGTLSRMRAEYVVPLTTKIIGRIEMLERDMDASASTAARSKIQKKIESFRKKQIELLDFDERLRNCADQRIVIDLDDGVKFNYVRFGDLLTDSAAVSGGGDD